VTATAAAVQREQPSFRGRRQLNVTVTQRCRSACVSPCVQTCFAPKRCAGCSCRRTPLCQINRFSLVEAPRILSSGCPWSGTVYPFCRAQSRIARPWSRGDAAVWTTRRERRAFCGVTRVWWSRHLANSSRSRGGVRRAEIHHELAQSMLASARGPPPGGGPFDDGRTARGHGPSVGKMCAVSPHRSR
jgi:hypothetical protein